LSWVCEYASIERILGLTDRSRHETLEEIMNEMAAKDIPMDRSETPEDVANIVAFLCSEANYMTG
jgi:NAD(P)-dependent dehydrogenase (short-subunit alcohol dehydrogenase family)